jgi:hypothetical protein
MQISINWLHATDWEPILQQVDIYSHSTWINILDKLAWLGLTGERLPPFPRAGQREPQGHDLITLHDRSKSAIASFEESHFLECWLSLVGVPI